MAEGVRVRVPRVADLQPVRGAVPEAVPRDAQLHQPVRGENLLAQFSLELILHDFFKQSCVRTMDPEEAHLFYVPFYNDVEYRWEGKRPNEASKFGQRS